MRSRQKQWQQVKRTEEFLFSEEWLSHWLLNQAFRQTKRTWLNVDSALPHEKLFEERQLIE
jgi:hypothetical protein